MNIYNLFDERELSALEQNDYIIEDKEYTFDEIDNILRNVKSEYYFEKVEKGEFVGIYKDIISKLKKVQKEMPEYFDLRKWRHRKIMTTDELKKFFIEEKVIGKKIRKIDLCGNSENLNKSRMRNLYNNDTELMKNDDWWLMSKITKEYIPDNVTRGLITEFDFPLVIEFDDGNTIEILSRNDGCYLVASNKIKNVETYSSEIIGKEFFKKVINSTVKDIKIEPFRTNNYWRYDAIKKEYKTESNPEKIKFIMDNGLNLEIINNMVGISDEEGFNIISIGEYKKCIKHYDWLFSKNAEERGSKYKDLNFDESKITEDEKDLISILREVNIPKGDIIGISVMMHATNKSGLLLEWLIQKIENDELEITTSEILEKALELIGRA